MKLIQTAGDMAIKDLTPRSTNIGDRIVKNMRICGSGIYTYARREARLLNLAPVPEKYNNLEYINVYRPPEVLEKYKDYFARVPIITGHHVRVDRNNAKELTVGMVGDTVESEVDKDDGETYLYTTGTIVAGDGVEAYEQYGQLSVGYDPIMAWEEGTHNGTPYQAVLKGFNDVNHLLICKVARGGPQCMVMDSLDDCPEMLQGDSPLEKFINTNHGGEDMGIFKKIFGSVKKEMAGDAAVVSVLLQAISAGANPKIQVQKVRDIVGDSDTTFNEYLAELEMAGDEKPEVVAKAVDIVDTYYKAHLAGDEKKSEEKKSDDEQKAGDEKPEEKKSDDEKKAGDEKKSAGDSIDYDLLADKVVARMCAKEESKEEKLHGDERIEDELSMPMGGDSGSTEVHGSDDFIKDIWG